MDRFIRITKMGLRTTTSSTCGTVETEVVGPRPCLPTVAMDLKDTEVMKRFRRKFLLLSISVANDFAFFLFRRYGPDARLVGSFRPGLHGSSAWNEHGRSATAFPRPTFPGQPIRRRWRRRARWWWRRWRRWRRRILTALLALHARVLSLGKSLQVPPSGLQWTSNALSYTQFNFENPQNTVRRI